MSVSMPELLEAGAHFGHQRHRWNPKMAPYIYSQNGKVHIIDLAQTEALLNDARDFVESVASAGRQVLFVGSKRQSAPIIRKEAERSNSPYINERWLGGILTNFPVIHQRVSYLLKLEQDQASGELEQKYTKKEVLRLREKAEKLNRVLSGIKQMNELPGALFVVDINHENIAITEAKSLGIPVVAIVDTNANPELVDYCIPANDDALKSIQIITQAIADSVISGSANAAKQTPAAEKDEEGKSNE
jgi:small subunit ribosomal protein S2